MNSLLLKNKNYLAQVYGILAIQLVITLFVVSYLDKKPVLAKRFNTTMYMILNLIASFALIFGIIYFESTALKFVCFAIFSVLNALLLSSETLNLNAKIVNKALLGAILVFVATTIFAFIISSQNVDLGKYGAYLSIGLVGIILAAILLQFSPEMNTTALKVYFGAGLVLFSLFTIYDTNNILLHPEINPVNRSLDFYLDFLNIFQDLLGLMNTN